MPQQNVLCGTGQDRDTQSQAGTGGGQGDFLHKNIQQTVDHSEVPERMTEAGHAQGSVMRRQAWRNFPCGEPWEIGHVLEDLACRGL